MAVAEKMCDFIFMIYKGSKVLDGTLDAIQRHLRRRHGPRAPRRPASDALEGLPGVAKVIDFGNFQELRLCRAATSRRCSALRLRGHV